MRRPALSIALAAGLLFAGAARIVAQEPGRSPNPSGESGQTSPGKNEAEAEGPSPIWAWANFAILAGLLGYFIVKKGGPWLVARSQAIRRGIAEAEEIRADAEARAAEVDRKLAGLEVEIAGLKDEARREQAAEAERIRQQTAADLARIREHAAAEIDSAGKTARLELKRYAGQLAVDLAEQKIRRQMSPELQSVLVENFARDLERPAATSHLNK